jgi:hypothetical protein
MTALLLQFAALPVLAIAVAAAYAAHRARIARSGIAAPDRTSPEDFERTIAELDARREEVARLEGAVEGRIDLVHEAVERAQEAAGAQYEVGDVLHALAYTEDVINAHPDGPRDPAADEGRTQ